MNLKQLNIDPSLKSIPETEFPTHLHARIMKRVFFVGYGKYLYLSTGVLFLNLGVLAREVYRTVAELKTPQFEVSVLTQNLGLPISVYITLAITALTTVYAFMMIYRLYKEYRVFVVAK